MASVVLFTPPLHAANAAGASLSLRARPTEPSLQSKSTAPTTGNGILGMQGGFVCAGLVTSALQRKTRRGKGQLRRSEKLARAAVKVDESEALPCVKLTNGDSEATVYLYGACVTSYKTDGNEWIAVRKDAKLDGSKPISGGLPFCWPQFGPGEIQQHGFARNLSWKVVQDKSSDTKCVLELIESEETLGMWANSFKLTYEVELTKDQMNTTFVVKNTDEKAWNFTGALHSYWDVDVNRCEIVGEFKGKDRLDKTQEPYVTAEAESDSVTIKQFTEEIYLKTLPGTVVVKDPSKGELAIENTGGWKDVVIWSPYGDENMGADKFICVESAETSPVELKAGEEWKAGMNLIPKH